MNTHLPELPATAPDPAPAVRPPASLEILIDLETLDTTPTSIVTQLAAATFTREEGRVQIIDELDLHLDPWEQLRTRRSYSPETIAFHQQHRTLPAGTDHEHPADALDALRHFAEGTTTVWIWGSDFDRPILEDLAHQHGRTLPWKYWQLRDARTVWKVAFADARPARRPHRAIEDVRASIHDLHRALQHLNR